MNVCIFGGSFDPVHISHVKLVESIVNKYDEVWIVVASSAPGKKHFESFEDRYNMCKLAFNYSNVKVLDVEHVNGFIYTVDTVKYFKGVYDYKFSVAVGSDQYNSLESWRDYEYLKANVDFECVSRPSFNYYDISNSMSSSYARVMRNSYIDNVNEYILDNDLYITKFSSDLAKVKNNTSDKRYCHVIGVYVYMLKLIARYDLNSDLCLLSVIYHDYLKESLNDEKIGKFKEKFPLYKNFPKAIMHGIIASYELELDETVLKAIRYHSIGVKYCSDEAKALYIADYLDEGRGFETTKYNMNEYSLEELYEMCREERNEWIVANLDTHPDVIKYRDGGDIYE